MLKQLDIPDPLYAKLEAAFGDAANTDAGMLVTALWFAIERYEAEHGELAVDDETADDSSAET